MKYKSNIKKRMKVVGILLMLIISTISLGTQAKQIKNYSFTISGTKGTYAPNSLKSVTNRPYAVNASMPSNRPRYVIKTTMYNSENAYRGNCDVYEGTRNTGANTGVAGHSYKLYCIRQYTWDGSAYTSGSWAADES